MKTIQLSLIGLAFALLSFTSVPALYHSEKNVKKTSIVWEKTEIHIGDIEQGKPVDIVFMFTNTGDTPVMINSVQASCGCTSTNFTRLPVLPKESTKITATFNAAAKGMFKKTVTVSTSAEETPRSLIFSGVVL